MHLYHQTADSIDNVRQHSPQMLYHTLFSDEPHHVKSHDRASGTGRTLGYFSQYILVFTPMHSIHASVLAYIKHNYGDDSCLFIRDGYFDMDCVFAEADNRFSKFVKNKSAVFMPTHIIADAVFRMAQRVFCYPVEQH